LNTLTTYAQFKPTGFDPAGLGLPDQQSWLVAPCTLNRDSDQLTQSNWYAQLAAVEEADPSGDDYETHQFNHWGCGWFEVLLVRPGSAAAAVCEELAERLADYPVLDEEDLSRLESEAYYECWEQFAREDFVTELRRKFSGYYRCNEITEEASSEQLLTFFESLIPSGDYYDPDSGCSPRVRYAVEAVTRSQFARFVAQLRKGGAM